MFEHLFFQLVESLSYLGLTFGAMTIGYHLVHKSNKVFVFIIPPFAFFGMISFAQEIINLYPAMFHDSAVWNRAESFLYFETIWLGLFIGSILRAGSIRLYIKKICVSLIMIGTLLFSKDIASFVFGWEYALAHSGAMAGSFFHTADPASIASPIAGIMSLISVLASGMYFFVRIRAESIIRKENDLSGTKSERL